MLDRHYSVGKRWLSVQDGCLFGSIARTQMPYSAPLLTKVTLKKTGIPWDMTLTYLFQGYENDTEDVIVSAYGNHTSPAIPIYTLYSYLNHAAFAHLFLNLKYGSKTKMKLDHSGIMDILISQASMTSRVLLDTLQNIYSRL